MSLLTINIPDHVMVALNENNVELAKELKLEYAKKLVKESKLTLAQGSELADISALEFMIKLSADGISVIDYPPDDLAHEINSFL